MHDVKLWAGWLHSHAVIRRKELSSNDWVGVVTEGSHILGGII